MVGVDGSEESRAALRWAIAQADRSGAPVDAVMAWQDPTQVGYLYGEVAVSVADESYGELAEKVLAATVAEVRSEADQPTVEIRTRVVAGHPSLVLPEAARGAELLVLGSRGRGAFVGMLLGSVSQHCVQHPTCPVVVIPAPAG